MIAKAKSILLRLLRWSERYTKTDMVYFASGGFWLTIGQGVAGLASLALSVAFANFMTAEAYGIYRYVLTVSGILSIATLTGMNTAITQAVSQGNTNITHFGLRERIRYGVLGGAVSLLVALYYYFNGNTILAISFLIAAMFLPFMDSFTIYDSYLQGQKKFKLSTIYFSVVQLIAISGLVIALWLTRGDIIVAVFTYFSLFTLLRFFAYIFSYRFNTNGNTADKKVLAYGKHLTFISIFSTIAGYADRLIIFHFLGAVPLAIYSFAIAPVMHLRALTDTVPILALPKLSQRSFKEIDTTFYRRLAQLTAVGILLAIVYILIAPFAFNILFPRYLDAISLSQLFALTIIIATPLSFLGPAFRSKPELLKEMYIGDSSGNVLLLVLLITLGSTLGLAGIILARILTLLFGFLLGIFLWKNYARKNITFSS